MMSKHVQSTELKRYKAENKQLKKTQHAGTYSFCTQSDHQQVSVTHRQQIKPLNVNSEQAHAEFYDKHCSRHLFLMSYSALY